MLANAVARIGGVSFIQIHLNKRYKLQIPLFLMHESIESLMCMEHKRVVSYLIDFEVALGLDVKEANRIWQKFKWNLEKHFFVEEKAIFNFYNNIGGEEISGIFEVMDEHGKILALVKEIERKLKEEDVRADIIKLKMLLAGHANFEDATLYPLLDLKLNDEQKKEIIIRAQEIIRG